MNQRHIGFMPHDISALIVRYKSVNQAEKAAGVAQGTFGKIRNGKHAYTDHVRERVNIALANHVTTRKRTGTMNSPKMTIPETCPPLLQQLLEKMGSKAKTRRVLKCGEMALNNAMAGSIDMPPDWIVKAKVELGQPVIGTSGPQEEVEGEGPPPGPVIPEFVPWDGKETGTVVIMRGGEKTRSIKNVPQPIVDLIAKAGGTVSQAAALCGRTAGWLLPALEDPKKKFKEPMQRLVHGALNGAAPMGKHSLGEDYDKYSLGLAICMLPAIAFDRVQDIADILNGRLVFRKSTKGGWLIIYRMGTEDLPRFKKLALRDANEIVCP